EGLGEADEPRQALRAADAGEETELHLGEAEHGLGIVAAHPRAATERELEAAAQAGAVDGGDDGHQPAEIFETLQRLLTALRELRRLGGRAHRLEHIDVSTDEKAVLLAGGDEQTPHLPFLDRRLDLTERLRELLREAGVQRVDRLAGHVETQ